MSIMGGGRGGEDQTSSSLMPGPALSAEDRKIDVP